MAVSVVNRTYLHLTIHCLQTLLRSFTANVSGIRRADTREDIELRSKSSLGSRRSNYGAALSALS